MSDLERLYVAVAALKQRVTQLEQENKSILEQLNKLKSDSSRTNHFVGGTALVPLGDYGPPIPIENVKPWKPCINLDDSPQSPLVTNDFSDDEEPS